MASDYYSDDAYSRGVSVANWLIDLPAFIGAIAFGKDCGRIFLNRKPIEVPFLATILTFISMVALFILLIIFVDQHRYELIII